MQSCHILDLVVEPSLFETIFNFLDIFSVSRLKSGVERHGGADWHLQENVSENQEKWCGKDLTQEESSKLFKKQISEYHIRKITFFGVGIT